MVLYGWDASDFDWDRGPMDLAAARRDGIDFFTHKATEGTSTKHKHFGESLSRARAAGIPFLGAYHVVRSPANAGAEVDYCLAYVNAQTPWWRDFPGWFWQVDLEKWPYDAVAASEGEAFADIIEARTGRRAVIYASKGQYGDQLTGTSHPLWNANYGSNPATGYRAAYTAPGGDTGAGWSPYSGVTPAIWQYGSKTVIGSQGTCDANAFRGDVAAFARLVGGSSTNVSSGGDLMANASEIIVAWSGGFPKTSDGQVVAPVDWRIRDEAWQKSVDAALAADKVRDTALATAVQALAVGAGIDGPGLLAQVEAAITAALAPLQQQLATVQARAVKLATALAAAGVAFEQADDA